MPLAEMDQKWEYCALGAVDGIDVGENILNDMYSTILESIWESQKRFCKSLKGNYAAQQIYALRYDDPDIEDNFWKGNEAYPFFFFCRIQCDENKIKVWNNRAQLEKAIQIKDKVKAMIYLTYDNTDLLLVLRTIKYDIGAELINELHQKANLSMDTDVQCIIINSYTIFAVRYEWIKGYALKNREELNKDKIDTVWIRIIENRNGIVNTIEKEIQQRLQSIKVECLSILGADDAVIILSEIGWGDFLSLYCKDTGVFTTRSGESFCKNTAGITTQIKSKGQGLQEELRENGLKISNPKNIGQNLWKKTYKRIIREIYDIIEKKETGDDLKEVYIILNTLSKFDGELFNDYAFFPILDSLRTLLELLQANATDKEQLYDFLNRFSIYAQSSAISDRHTTQMLSFNSRIYDIPIKIVAYYNAYLYNVKKILNTEDEKKYSFFVVPARNDYVKVSERFMRVSVGQRLMIVEIPEYSAYRLNDMMIILTHESAHYVGDFYRDRDLRYQAVLNSYTHIYIRFIKDNIVNMKLEKSKEDFIWEEVEEKTLAALLQRIPYEYDPDFFLNRHKLDVLREDKIRILDRRKKYSKYFLELGGFIRESMSDILSSGLNDLFSPILYNLDDKQHKETINSLQELAECFMNEYPEGSTRLISSTVLSRLQSFYRECFADLMVILILGMNAEEYIETLISNAKLQGMEVDKFCQSEVIFRLIAILITILKGGTDQAAEWEKQLADDGIEDWQRAGKCALEQWNRLSEKNMEKPGEYSKNVLYAFRDKLVVNDLVCYLLRCQDLFLASRDKNSEYLTAIQDVFKECKGQLFLPVEDQLSKMEKFICDYKKNLL